MPDATSTPAPIPPGPIGGSYSGDGAALALGLAGSTVRTIAARLGLGTTATGRLKLYTPAEVEQIRAAHVGRPFVAGNDQWQKRKSLQAKDS